MTTQAVLEQGQLVDVRGRRYVVTDVASSTLAPSVLATNGWQPQHLAKGHDYDGRLFDPDRFPFLEGRPAGTSWQDTPAQPLPIHNRTVLHLLDALQMLRVKTPGGGPAEARRLSFRALDIEQIGHVYEGLLDHTARRASEPARREILGRLLELNHQRYAEEMAMGLHEARTTKAQRRRQRAKIDR